MVLVKFVMSCDTLWGYSMTLDPQWYVSMNAIIECVVSCLRTMLKNHGLDVLYEKTKDMKFHIHDHTMESLCSVPSNGVVYICDHCDSH